MIYKTRRFSSELLTDGIDYIDNKLAKGNDFVYDVSTKITEDPRLKELKPVKKHGRFVRNISQLLKRKKKKHKEFSEERTQINPSEAVRFKTDLQKVTNTLNDSQSII